MHKRRDSRIFATSDDDNAAAPPPQPPLRNKKKPVTVAWITADNKKRGEVTAFPGDNLFEVATRAAAAAGEGDSAIEAGCYSGSCGLCEVEVRGVVARSCIGVVPAGFDVVEVRALSDDVMWNQDAWET